MPRTVAASDPPIPVRRSSSWALVSAITTLLLGYIDNRYIQVVARQDSNLLGHELNDDDDEFYLKPGACNCQLRSTPRTGKYNT